MHSVTLLSHQGSFPVHYQVNIFASRPFAPDIFEEALPVLYTLCQIKFQMGLSLSHCIPAYSDDNSVFLPHGLSSFLHSVHFFILRFLIVLIVAPAQLKLLNTSVVLRSRHYCYYSAGTFAPIVYHDGTKVHPLCTFG